jgi:hypothetical protein
VVDTRGLAGTGNHCERSVDETLPLQTSVAGEGINYIPTLITVIAYLMNTKQDTKAPGGKLHLF